MMSLFQCQNCGCAENTAVSAQGTRAISGAFDWTGIEDRKGMLLCSACAPTKFMDGKDTGYGKWHGMFRRVFLPMDQFFTNKYGNLEHKSTGSIKYHQYELHR